MNTRLNIGLIILLVVLNTFTSCDSTTSPGQSPCGDPSPHLQKISLVLDGKLYDFDSLPGFVYSIEKRWSSFTSEFTVKYTRFGDGPEYSLLLKLPMYKTGLYGWSDRSIDSNAFGFQFDIDSLPMAKRRSYRSVVGSTNVIVYDSQGNDSLFSTFCGKVRDDSGAILELTDGMCYFIDQ
jgi:hypothetical protein